jgi:predicted metal-binding protein
VKKDIKTFIHSACELGAFEAKLVEAASIVTAPWVRLKCRFGCDGYNTSLCCPPNTPTYLDMREVISCYKHALLIHCKDTAAPPALSANWSVRFSCPATTRPSAWGPGHASCAANAI